MKKLAFKESTRYSSGYGTFLFPLLENYGTKTSQGQCGVL